MDGNYIKLSREILDWEWYHNINTCRVFLHMLLKANWKSGKFEGTMVPRGSFISSIGTLSMELNLTVDEIRTAVKHLEKTGEITKQTTNKYTIFTVKNYCRYQDVTEQIPNEYQTNTEQTPFYSQTIPNNRRKEEIKKGRKEKEKKEGTNVPKKKEPPVYYPSDEELDKAFADYVEMRKKIKKPMTDRAIELAMSKLQKLAATSSGMDNDLAIKILDQSVMNSWQGLFELKEDKRMMDAKDGIDWSKI